MAPSSGEAARGLGRHGSRSRLFLARWHVLAGVGGGALTYLATLWLIGGLRPEELRAIVSRGANAVGVAETPRSIGLIKMQ